MLKTQEYGHSIQSLEIPQTQSLARLCNEAMLRIELGRDLTRIQGRENSVDGEM